METDRSTGLDEQRTKLLEEPNYQVTPYRWLILVCFMGCVFNNGMLTLTFTPIAIDVASMYDVSIFWVNMCAISFLLVFIPMNFVTIYLFKTWPPQYVLRLACVI